MNKSENSSKRILALDFDGVICDSVRELAMSGWRTWRLLESENAKIDLPDPVLHRFIELRPVIRVGYQSVLLLQMIEEEMSGDRISADFDGQCDRIMADRRLDPEKLIQAFGAARDQWIKNDLIGWLAAHDFYPGVVDKLRENVNNGTPIVIITTKERRFAQQLLFANDVMIRPENVFGLREGKKADVLSDRGQTGGNSITFVDDRLETLEAIAGDARLDAVQLYLATWGYNTDGHRRRARNDSRIELLGLADFLNTTLTDS